MVMWLLAEANSVSHQFKIVSEQTIDTSYCVQKSAGQLVARWPAGTDCDIYQAMVNNDGLCLPFLTVLELSKDKVLRTGRGMHLNYIDSPTTSMCSLATLQFAQLLLGPCCVGVLTSLHR